MLRGRKGSAISGTFPADKQLNCSPVNFTKASSGRYIQQTTLRSDQEAD
jgi:hypothetical protein